MSQATNFLKSICYQKSFRWIHWSRKYFNTNSFQVKILDTIAIAHALCYKAIDYTSLFLSSGPGENEFDMQLGPDPIHAGRLYCKQ